MLSKSCWFSRI